MSLRKREVLAIDGGVLARVQLGCLYAAGSVLRRFRFRGMQRISWALGACFPSTNSVILVLNSEARVQIYLDDGYWTKLLFAEYEYEPELTAVIRDVLNHLDRPIFVDCGANIGFWSAHAASQGQGRCRVISIEAFAPTFDRLLRNSALNSGSFECLKRAVWNTPGLKVAITGSRRWHAGASVVPQSRILMKRGVQTYLVETVTLDELFEDFDCTGRPVVLKLDVEEAELAALEGAQRLLADNPVVVIYEEHGAIAENAASHFLIEKLNYQVFFCGENGRLCAVKSEEDLRQLKTDKARGFNCLAVSRHSCTQALVHDLNQQPIDGEDLSPTFAR